MLVENKNRFKDLIWFNAINSLNCVIGGCGGIGSWLSLLLSRLDMKIYLYDFDRIEPHNVGGQLFKMRDVGSYKALSMSNTLLEFSGADCNYRLERYTKDSIKGSIMFSAFDNMQARKTMFENFKNFVSVTDNNSPSYIKPIFIDGRLGAEYFEIYCVTKDKIEEYEKTLFDDSEVQDLPCTAKQTSHTAAMIAANMVGFFTNHISNCTTNSDERVVPFKYIYSIPNCFTEVVL
jgi:molybdopterin/thiamine biosynthesis adenylyltransferase